MRIFSLYYAASILGDKHQKKFYEDSFVGQDEYPFTSRSAFQRLTFLQYEDASTKISFVA